MNVLHGDGFRVVCDDGCKMPHGSNQESVAVSGYLWEEKFYNLYNLFIHPDISLLTGST